MEDSREGQFHSSTVPAASPENIHASKILWTLQVMFRNTYAHVNTYVHAKTINNKRGHRFEGNGKGVYGGACGGGKGRKGC